MDKVDKKVLEQLGAQKHIYKMAKASFESHAKDCENRFIEPEGKKRCSHPRGGALCTLSQCPKISKEKEG